MFSLDFRKALSARATPRSNCAFCSFVRRFNPGERLRLMPGQDVSRAFALGIAARVSYGSDVAEKDLGMSIPWRRSFRVHVDPVDSRGHVVISAVVDGVEHSLDLDPVWPLEPFERMCRSIVMDSVVFEETRTALEAQLRLRWAEANFHTCGISYTPAVARVVDLYRALRDEEE